MSGAWEWLRYPFKFFIHTVVWFNQSPHDVCSSLSGVDSVHWVVNESVCADLINRTIDKYVLLSLSIFGVSLITIGSFLSLFRFIIVRPLIGAVNGVGGGGERGLPGTNDLEQQQLTIRLYHHHHHHHNQGEEEEAAATTTTTCQPQEKHQRHGAHFGNNNNKEIVVHDDVTIQ